MERKIEQRQATAASAEQMASLAVNLDEDTWSVPDAGALGERATYTCT